MSDADPVFFDGMLLLSIDASPSSCGCRWGRTAEYGDIVIVQCLRHALECKKAREDCDAGKHNHRFPKE